MITIKIAHLYYDLMNLNGESGNLIALKKHFEAQKVKVEIHFLTIDDHIDFEKYDIYYIGNGSNENKLFVLKNLQKYSSEIKKAIDDNKYFFITGNSFELFGKSITNLDQTITNCLSTFNYYCVTTTDNFDFKVVGEQVCSCPFIKEKIIGFENRFEKAYDIDNYLFNDVEEGFYFNNFYATFLLGPLFIRNPYLTDYFVKKILDEKSIKFIPNVNTLEYQAYNEYLKNFVKQ